VQQLNDRFAVPGQVIFKLGPGGLPVAEITNPHASATIVLQGGHILAFQPHDQEPVLWVSRFSAYKAGQAIRGGIPVCWPWFGPHPTDPDKPGHGFARVMPWTVQAAQTLAGGATQLQLGLADHADTHILWPHAFELKILVTIGPELQIALITHNAGEQAFVCGAALHSYFRVSQVADVVIHGLEGGIYLDKVDQMRRKTQSGPVTLTSETDRIYLDSTQDCLIDDSGLARRIRIAKQGSRSTVVWNPWAAKAHSMADFGDHEYTEMVCVETANAAEDVVTVPSGGAHHLQAVISVEAIP